MHNQKINVKGTEIVITKQKEGDYISLTDMAKYKNYDSGVVISNWLTSKYTIQFIGMWEQLYNPIFNLMEFHKIKNEVGTNGFIVSSSMWIKNTNAIGIKSSAGRYGGTFAHKDIAFEFATWLSPEFKLYLIKEFQRLQEQENDRLSLDWDVKRTLTKRRQHARLRLRHSTGLPSKSGINECRIHQTTTHPAKKTQKTERNCDYPNTFTARKSNHQKIKFIADF